MTRIIGQPGTGDTGAPDAPEPVRAPVPAVASAPHGAAVPAEQKPAPRKRRPRPLRERLGDLNPVSILMGPVFLLELRIQARHRSTFLARAAYPLLLLLVIALAYVAMLDELRGYSGAAYLERLQGFAPVLVTVVAWCQCLALSFWAPVITAPAICEEKRSRTLATLATTPLTAAQIVVGKLTGRMAQLLILAFCPTPLLLALRVFGGVEAETIVAFACVGLANAVLAGSLGLLFSVWHRRAAYAAAMAQIVTILVTAAPPVVYWSLFVMGLATPAGAPPMWFLALSPGVCMGFLSAQANGATMPIPLTRVWGVNVGYTLTLSAVVTGFAVMALRRVMLAQAAGSAPALATGGAREGRQIDAPGSSDEGAEGSARTAGRATERATREVWDDPILWRELRQSSLPKGRRNRVVLGVTLLGAFVWIYAATGLDEDRLHGAVGLIALVLCALMAALGGPAAFSSEKEDQSWPVLLTTGLTPERIVLGKALGALLRLWPVGAVLVGHALVTIWFNRFSPWLLIHVPLAFLMASVPALGFGAWAGLRFSRGSAASACTLAFIALLWIGLPLGSELVLKQVLPRGLFHEMECWVVTINPFYMLAMALDSGVGWHSAAEYPVASKHFGPAGFTAYMLAGAAALGAVSAWFLRRSVKHFNRYTGRAS